MGAYLSEPVVDKQTESEESNGIQYGATSMQGWRINQEDSHNCILNFDEGCAFFAVYDGHGGADVSQYAARKFPDFLKSMSTWREGRLGQALEDAFLTFDELLTHDDVMEELKVLAGTKKENEGEDVDEDKALLYEEAGLPLESVLQRYGLNIDRSLFITSGDRLFVAPKAKIKREKRAPATTTAVDDEEGPPTPPSSPDARSAAAAAAAMSTTTNDGSSARQDNVEPQPMSPPNVGTSSPQSKRARYALKRKSRAISSTNNVDDDQKLDPADHKESDPTEVDGGCDSSQTNGVTNANSGAQAFRPDSPLEELPHIKRFKDDGVDNKRERLMAADSTTILEEPVTLSPAAAGDEQSVNGSHSLNDRANAADSTSTNECKGNANNGSGATSILGNKDVGSPMIIEDPPNAVNRINEDKTTENKSCAMDESSGASEDDEDEDYNMEVGDDESSEEGSSESNGIEEDETGEQDAMGVDEEEDEEEDDEDEEEAEDDDMFAMPSGDTPGVDSGTTACVAVIKGSTIYVANAGDSRCVLCRGDVAIDLSADHKPEDATEKRRIESAGGRITTDGRVNGGLNLSRAIGDHFYKRNSELPLKDQMITALPDIRVESVKPEDRFIVLACDGIWNSMSSQDVVDFVRSRLTKGLKPEIICEQLCDVCLAPNTIGDGTGCDNMTAIIVLINQNSANSNPATVESTGNVLESSDGDGK